CFIRDLIFAPVASTSSTGLKNVVFTLITPIFGAPTLFRKVYAKAPLTKIDLQLKEAECSNLLSNWHPLSWL
ncbi:MAG: hypothetical protein II070_02510, partial [Treponema sp.]|nr:hypothetical protein [Treponema sp.]